MDCLPSGILTLDLSERYGKSGTVRTGDIPWLEWNVLPNGRGVCLAWHIRKPSACAKMLSALNTCFWG